ncbi:DUF4013 domain-containing protein [Candidatus Dojkabacteria bacterium]|nr:DUF4013 domain-containing protein [Candidatus Dojkabacteria bacterium]
MALKIDPEKIIKAPFIEKDWWKKAGTIALLFFCVILLTVIFQMISSFIAVPIIGLIFAGIEESAAMRVETDLLLSAVAAVVILIVYGGMSLILIPLFIYLTGYINRYAKAVMQDQNAVLPKHENIKQQMKFGFRAFVSTATYNVIFALVANLVFILPFVLLLNDFDTYIWGVVAFAVVYSLIYTAGTVLFNLISTSSGYIFLKTNSVRKALKFSNIKKVIKDGWKHILVLWGLNIILWFIIYAIWIFTSCFGFITMPIIASLWMIYSGYLKGYVLGQLKVDNFED